MKKIHVSLALIIVALMLPTHMLVSQVIEQNKPSLPSVWRTDLTSYGARSAEMGPDGAYVFVFDEGKLRRLRGEDGVVDWSENLVFLGLGGFVENRQITMMKSTPYFIICGDVVDTNGDYYSLMQIRSYPTGQLVREQLFPSVISGSVVVSDDDRLIAVTRDDYYTVFNATTGDTVWSRPKKYPASLATCWTRDSTRLLVVQSPNGDNHLEIVCWDVERNVEVWNRPFTGGILTSAMSIDGKRILFHSLLRNNTIDYILYDFPSMKMVSSTASSGLSSNCMLPSSDASYVIVTARHTRMGDKQNLALFDFANEVEREIDSVGGRLSSKIIGNTFIRYGSEFVEKLRFDWVTSVLHERETANDQRLLIPNPCQGESSLEYVVPELQYVRVSMFDTQGKLIKVLVDGQQEGLQLLHVDCTSLPSGVYYCEIVIGKEKHLKLLQVTSNGGVK